MITDEIEDAIRKEAVAFCASVADGTIGTPQVIMATDFKADDMMSYGMPLLIINMIDGQETSQYPGGVTRVDWAFGFNSYAYAPDANVDDLSTYPPSLKAIIDKIRVHFSAGLVNNLWLTQGMIDIFDNYNFSLTLLGVSRADPLNQDGLINGWKLNFDSIALDNLTRSTQPSDGGIEDIVNDNSIPG